MKDRLLLLGYASAVIAATSIHDPVWLAAGLLVVASLAGRQAPKIGWRALWAVLLFNLVISIGYAASALFGQTVSVDYLILVNVRVYLLIFLTFTLASRIDILRALSFSRGLSYLATLVFFLIMLFKLSFDSYKNFVNGFSHRIGFGFCN